MGVLLAGKSAVADVNSTCVDSARYLPSFEYQRSFTTRDLLTSVCLVSSRVSFFSPALSGSVPRNGWLSVFSRLRSACPHICPPALFVQFPPQFSEEVVNARSLVRNSIEKKLKEEAKLAK